MPILSWETREDDLRKAAAAAYHVLENRGEFGDADGGGEEYECAKALDMADAMKARE